MAGTIVALARTRPAAETAPTNIGGLPTALVYPNFLVFAMMNMISSIPVGLSELQNVFRKAWYRWYLQMGILMSFGLRTGKMGW